MQADAWALQGVDELCLAAAPTDGSRGISRTAGVARFCLMTQPHVEVLVWDGCPSHPKALAELRAMMTELGLDPEAVVVREVDTDDAAERERFVGSPTIRVDGRDLQPPGPDEPVGLSCRVYRLRDGRVSPTPDPEDVREALLAATNGV